MNKEQIIYNYFKYMFIVMGILLIIAILVIIYKINSIRGCEYKNVELIDWIKDNTSEVNDYSVLFDKYGKIIDSNYRKEIIYKFNETIYKYKINQSGNLTQIKNIYPVEKNYTFVFCNNKLNAIVRRGKLNDLFFSIMAKTI